MTYDMANAMFTPRKRSVMAGKIAEGGMAAHILKHIRKYMRESLSCGSAGKEAMICR